MRILLVHNSYQQAGGEDQVFRDESALLRSRGHEVREFTVHNNAVETMGRLELARKTVWNRVAYDELRRSVRAHRSQVVHFHNTFPLISPAGYRAAHDEKAAVVQTLHNYRLLCPAATFYRQDRACEDCMGKFVPWPGVLHGCYRNSRLASGVVMTMLTVHRALRTWRDEVDLYVALTKFARDKFVQGGLPPQKILVKPNFVDPDPGFGSGDGGFALFVGRLAQEKGVATLLRAAAMLDRSHRVEIVGDGPLREQVLEACQRIPNLDYLGRRPLQEVAELMGQAAVLVFPSQWYEGLPRTIIESYAKGTPVIASRLGSMIELVETARTGWLFTPGDAQELAQHIRHALSSSSDLGEMRRHARLEFERSYTADRNYELLLDLYEKAIHLIPSEPQARRSDILKGSDENRDLRLQDHSRQSRGRMPPPHASGTVPRT